MKIELDAPNVGELEKKYLSQVIDHGFVSTFGPFISEFEKRMADYLGAAAAAAVQSGTAAISMALHESGIGPGDEVIVPPLTFTATVNPVLYVGATPVIVDVDPFTWNIDPLKIKKAITSRTKAVIPVHLYGNPCDMSGIMDVAGQYGLCVIEDATESLGATFNSRHTGTFGDFGCFSFNGNKLITTGGGGMIVSNNIEKIDHIRYLVNQAKDKDNPSFHSEMGFNYRMTNIEAALGMAQFEKMEGFLEKKRIFKEIYKEAFADLPHVRFQEKYPGAQESFWFTCISIHNGRDIPELMQVLKKKEIPTRRIFVPVNEMPYLKKFPAHCPCADEIYKTGLCLPSSTSNQEEAIQETALIIKEVIE